MSRGRCSWARKSCSKLDQPAPGSAVAVGLTLAGPSMRYSILGRKQLSGEKAKVAWTKTRARRALLGQCYLLVAIVAFSVVFSAGFSAWFQQDDFAHLKLAAATSLGDLPGMMARPIAQGTFRPLSERLFYWVLYHS